MRRTSALALLLLFALPSSAQQAKEPSLYDRAIAAGYKALTLCSGIFDARAVRAERSRESIEANELKGIYPEYDSLIADLPAEIGKDRVLVRYDPALPPRVAISRVLDGCTIMPIGTPADVRDLGVSVRALSTHRNTLWPYNDGSPAPTTPAALRPLFDAAFAGTYGAGSNTTALVIVRDGKLIAERYAAGFGPEVPQRTWSVAKSLTGTYIGMLAAKGLIDVHAAAPVPEWQAPGDPRATITLDNLLRMASGLHSDTAGNRTDAIYFGGTAVTEQAVAWPLEALPGTRFRYANNDILLAVRAVLTRLPNETRNPLPGDLVDAIDMRHTVLERDWKGNYILSSQVWSTARDLARLGMFWLQDGVWGDQRLLPEGWVKYMTTPSGPQPATGPGYGATMWLFGPAQGLPEGSYAAQGNRGQFVMVLPSRNLVVVRRGEDPGPARFDIARFTAEVLETLK